MPGNGRVFEKTLHLPFSIIAEELVAKGSQDKRNSYQFSVKGEKKPATCWIFMLACRFLKLNMA